MEKSSFKNKKKFRTKHKQKHKSKQKNNKMQKMKSHNHNNHNNLKVLIKIVYVLKIFLRTLSSKRFNCLVEYKYTRNKPIARKKK